MRALLGRVDLLDRIDDRIRTLSGGQSRRVEIARSLIHAPRLLILDEPTVGLDLRSRTDILSIVRGLVRDEGLAVLWATHIFEEVDPEDPAVSCTEATSLPGAWPASWRNLRVALTRLSA